MLTLESLFEKLKSLIKGVKEAISECDAIARNPNFVFDEQVKWAEARKKGLLEALGRLQQQYEETSEKLSRLSAESH